MVISIELQDMHGRKTQNEHSTISSRLILQATRAIIVTHLEARASVYFDNEGGFNTGT